MCFHTIIQVKRHNREIVVAQFPDGSVCSLGFFSSILRPFDKLRVLSKVEAPAQDGELVVLSNRKSSNYKTKFRIPLIRSAEKKTVVAQFIGHF